MNITDKINKYEIIDLIRTAINEDLGGYGDITSKFLIPEESKSSAYIICKEQNGAVLSGIDIAGYIIEELGGSIEFNKIKNDSEDLNYFDKICTTSGSTQILLIMERTYLNFLQHMSGIATYTKKFSSVASEYNVKIADTRKTKPGLRKIEKYAVICGGGFNHRFGLFDGILIKDNHIFAAGGIKEAIDKIRNRVPHQLKIEVEVKDWKELGEAIKSNADIIMLDNMELSMIKESVLVIRESLGSRCKIEVSGGISLTSLEEICKTGIDIISVGAITHSAPSVDFSLEFE
jgi:nicotinate-nucleotide pyrophosphorylase (carboxylating)